MVKNVLLGGIFLVPVLAGLSGERALKKRWELLEKLRQALAGAVLLLQNSRRPLERELEVLRQGAEKEELGQLEGEMVKQFVSRTATASRGELLMLGREGVVVLTKAAEEAEAAYKSRGRLWRALGLVGGSGILLLLM